MNRRSFLRMISMMPLLKLPNFLSKVSKPVVHHGSTSPLDEVDFPYVATGPHRDTADLIGQWDTAHMFPTQVAIDYESPEAWSGCAWINTELDNDARKVSLEVEHLPTKDILWFCVDRDRICVGEMLPDVTVSWWVEPRVRHTVYCEDIPLFGVPADGKTHFVAVTWENGHPVRAYLDSDAVWFSDVKLDEEGAQSQWGYTW